MKIQLEHHYRLNNGEVITIKDTKSAEGKTAYKDAKGNFYDSEGKRIDDTLTVATNYQLSIDREVKQVYLDSTELKAHAQICYNKAQGARTYKDQQTMTEQVAAVTEANVLNEKGNELMRLAQEMEANQ